MPRQYVSIPYLGGTVHVRREIFDEIEPGRVVRTETLLEASRLLDADDLHRESMGYLHAAEEIVEGVHPPRRYRAPSQAGNRIGAVAAWAILLGGVLLAVYAAGWL